MYFTFKYIIRLIIVFNLCVFTSAADAVVTHVSVYAPSHRIRPGLRNPSMLHASFGKYTV